MFPHLPTHRKLSPGNTRAQEQLETAVKGKCHRREDKEGPEASGATMGLAGKDPCPICPLHLALCGPPELLSLRGNEHDRSPQVLVFAAFRRKALYGFRNK